MINVAIKVIIQLYYFLSFVIIIMNYSKDLSFVQGGELQKRFLKAVLCREIVQQKENKVYMRKHCWKKTFLREIER